MTSSTLTSLRSTRDFVDVCDRLLAHGHAVRFRAEGWSMYPAIRDGETVEVVPIAASEIRRGDILLCRLGSASVAHRVIRIHKRAGAASRIVLRGDAAFANDAPIGMDDVLGKVTATTRAGMEKRLDTRTAGVRGALVARAWRAKRWIATRI